MFTLGMAATLFMAGIELDFSAMKGHPLSLALSGWVVSLLVGLAVIGLLHIIPGVQAPMMVTLAVCTTALGMLIPILGDIGQRDTPFGRLLLPVGTVGELAPVVAMALLLSRQYSTWQEFGFLLVFLAIVGIATAVGIGARPPASTRHPPGLRCSTGTQLPGPRRDAHAGCIVYAGRRIRI